MPPFDWTFTTDYTGTISGFAVEETTERIDMDKLRRKDKILFYHDLTLFEDELHDNGIAVMSVKIVRTSVQFSFLFRIFNYKTILFEIFTESDAWQPFCPLTLLFANRQRNATSQRH